MYERNFYVAKYRFQPTHLIKSLIGAKVWKKLPPLLDAEKIDYKEAISKMEIPKSKLKENFEVDFEASAQAGN